MDMNKLLAKLATGATLYGFALDKKELDQLAHKENILFSFCYADLPNLTGLICFTEKDPIKNYEEIEDEIIMYISREGLYAEDVRVFVMIPSVLEQLKEVPFWQYTTQVEINDPSDSQMFFSASSKDAIVEYFKKSNIELQIGFGI
jgi:hypothetical protein